MQLLSQGGGHAGAQTRASGGSGNDSAAEGAALVAPRLWAHADAFRNWASSITDVQLVVRTHPAWLRASTKLIVSRTAEHDARAHRAAWTSWQAEGPARGLSRLHRITRVATGWVPIGVDEPTLAEPGGEAGVDDGVLGVAEDQVQVTSAVPLSAQEEVDHQAASVE